MSRGGEENFSNTGAYRAADIRTVQHEQTSEEVATTVQL